MAVIDKTGQPFEPGHPFHGGTQIIFGARRPPSSQGQQESRPSQEKGWTKEEAKEQQTLQLALEKDLLASMDDITPTRTTKDKEEARSRLSSMLLGRTGPLPVEPTSEK